MCSHLARRVVCIPHELKADDLALRHQLDRRVMSVKTLTTYAKSQGLTSRAHGIAPHENFTKTPILEMTFKVLRTEGVGLGPRLLFSIGCRFGSPKRLFDSDLY